MSDYMQDMEAKLQAARARVKQAHEIKNLKLGAPTLFEIIDGEISLALNKLAGTTPLSHDEYLSMHGKIVGIKSIRDLLNFKEAEAVQATQEVSALEGNIKQLKDDQKH